MQLKKANALILLALMLIIITIANAENALYSTTFTAPYCSIATSPCVANSSLLISRDTISGTVEPNQPNTIDTCTDGTLGAYATDESVDNITITDLNHSYFRPGDTVNVSAVVYCYNNLDYINFIYTNNSENPSWRLLTGGRCPGTGFYVAFYSFQLDNVEANHSIRVSNQYRASATCGTGSYDDNDDVVLRVLYDHMPPIWQNQGENTSAPAVGDPVLLYAQGKDETALDYAVLSTNETGSWVNYSGVYGSPMSMGEVANTWVWSNFTWQNTSVTSGTNVCWRIWYNDSSNNWNSTNEMCFTVGAVGPVVWTDKSTYNATETVLIQGTGFGNNSVVKLWIKDNLSSNAVGYPQNVSTNSTGGFSHSWDVNYACPGTYYITAIDQNENELQASTSFIINYTISSSTLQKTPDYAEDDNGDATTAVSASDDVYAVAYLSPWQQENYIYMNWSNSIPAGATIQQANITLEHSENVDYLYLDYFDGSNWIPSCGLTISSSDITETCDLSSFITTVSKANSVELRLRGVRITSGGGWRTMLLDYALLSIYYNTTPLCNPFLPKGVNTNYAQYSSCDPRVYFSAAFYNDSEQQVTEYATYELLNTSKQTQQQTSAWATPTYNGNFYLYDNYSYGSWYLRVKTSCYSSVFPFIVGEDGTDVWKINISFNPDKAVYKKGDLFNTTFLVLNLKGEGVPNLGSNISASLDGITLTLNDEGNGYYSAQVNTSELTEERTYAVLVTAYTSSSIIVRNTKSFYLRRPV